MRQRDIEPGCDPEPYAYPLADQSALPPDYYPKRSIFRTGQDDVSSLSEKVLLDIPLSRESDLYTVADVARRLQTPAGYANGSPGHPYALPVARQHRVPVSYLESSRWSFLADGPMQKTYNGPIYLQGNEGTCHAWALIHAMHAVGLEPDVTLATELLNGALPSDTNAEGGLGHFAAAALIGDSAPFAYEFAHALGERKLDHETFAIFLKTTIDENGAIIASTKDPDAPKAHAVALVGYSLDTDSYMNAQFIDSNDGEHSVPVEDFMAWANESGYSFPSIQFTIIRNKLQEQKSRHKWPTLTKW